MKESKVVVFHAPDRPLELIRVGIPPLKSGELLIRNEYTTLCRSDLKTFSGERKEKTPTILGHETVGRIIAFGAETPRTDQRGRRLEAGDRITWAIFAGRPDGEMAKAGIPQKEKGLFKYGHEQFTEENTLHGGLGQHTLLRPHTPVVKIDEAVPLPVAAILNCAVATIAGAVRLAGNLTGKRVLVSGTGMLGMVACAMSKTDGAQQVIAVDVDEHRLALSKKFGADFATKAIPDRQNVLRKQLPDEPSVDVVIETSGVPEAMENTLEVVGIGGMAIWVGAVFPQRPLRIDAERVVRHIHTIRGLHNYNEQDLVRAAEFMETHHRRFPFVQLIYDPYTLDQVNEAFAYALRENPFRVGVKV